MIPLFFPGIYLGPPIKIKCKLALTVSQIPVTTSVGPLSQLKLFGLHVLRVAPLLAYFGRCINPQILYPHPPRYVYDDLGGRKHTGAQHRTFQPPC